MKLVLSGVGTNNATTNDDNVNTTMNNPCNSNRSAPLPNVHPHGSISTLSSDLNHNQEGAINEVVNLNTGNLKS